MFQILHVIVTYFIIIAITFRDMLHWIMRGPRGWQVSVLHYTAVVQITLNSVKLRISLIESDCCCTLWNETLPSFNVFYASKKVYCIKDKLSYFIRFLGYFIYFWYFVNSWTCASYVENRLWGMWQYYWSQLIANTNTPLYTLCTYNLKCNCVWLVHTRGI